MASHSIKFTRGGTVNLDYYRSKIARQRIAKIDKDDLVKLTLALLDTALLYRRDLKTIKGMPR